MKKTVFCIINILILSLFIFNNLQINTYSSININSLNEVIDIMDELKKTSLDFNTNLTKAFNYKLSNEKPTDLLNTIDNQIKKLNTLRVSTLKNVQNPSINNTDRQYYLLLSIITGYYRLSYEELRDYLNTNNIEQNYKSLYGIYTNLYQGTILINSLESELKLAS
ncbi:Uncharacterised protein [uncultured Clostridium sp.]|uniref:hypothetical protein n=1 Tax=uncultured Clostridium sp. TaxID=59620 RepID=UPI000821EA34|nr:hypothetical protein [uncultured Clostridium sp.]SCJ89617.1 Uncharacterised protein [uncultured Clostridium sp.]